MMITESEIWCSEYEIRQFIHIATGWQIDLVYNYRISKLPYSTFTEVITHARENFEKFAIQLRTRLSQIENWNAIGIDLNSRFFVGINQYIKWYYENLNEIEKFKHYCPYTIMLSITESTKSEILKYFPEYEALPPPPPETKTEDISIEMKPVLKPEAVTLVFDIIKDFFTLDQQTELKQILETGNNAKKTLLFKDNGNRLTDVFKKLIEHDFITGCQKQHLEKWIVSNFLFLHNGTQKGFKPEVVNKYVSAGDKSTHCKSPIIEIKNGQIQKVGQPRIKKYDNY